METKQNTILKGGEFLIKKTDSKDIFIPEQWDEEQKMIAQTCQEFLEQEIFPNLDRIDNMEEGLMPSLLDKAGELGILGISIPEELGGFGKKLCNKYVNNRDNRCRAFICCGFFCSYWNWNITYFILW